MRFPVLTAVLLLPLAASAAPCPTVMIVLDRSGSMDQKPDGSFGSPSKLDLAKMAISTLMMKYGDRIPFGFTTFQEGTCSIGAGDGIDILVEPKHGSASSVVMNANATVSGGGTNTAYAIDKVAADPNMHDPMRPATYMMLITDGEPNCPNDPMLTVARLKAAAGATMPVKTFIIGFGALPAPDVMAMDMMATAGGTACTDATLCAGHKFYVADTGMALNAAIDAISQVISGEFGGVCDDSCYSNGCMNAGEICVGGKCKPDPCSNVTTCAPGDYCFTDGNSAGTCVHSCPMPCMQGQVCTPQGTCQNDPCASVTCTGTQVCKGGQCVDNICADPAKMCPPGQLCYQGGCLDDPCHYVKCPDNGSMCVSGTGACAATLTTGGGMGGGHQRGKSGCELGDGSPRGAAAASIVLLGLALVLRRRRKDI